MKREHGIPWFPFTCLSFMAFTIRIVRVLSSSTEVQQGVSLGLHCQTEKPLQNWEGDCVNKAHPVQLDPSVSQ